MRITRSCENATMPSGIPCYLSPSRLSMSRLFEVQRCTMPASLFRAQGLCGVELTGAPRGDDAGASSGDGEDDDDGREDPPVEGTHAVEHLAQELDSSCTARESDEKADRYRCEAIGEGEAHDFCALRTKGDANAE